MCSTIDPVVAESVGHRKWRPTFIFRERKLADQALLVRVSRSELSRCDGFQVKSHCLPQAFSYVVESTQDLASGQWEAITTVEGSGRHEVIEMPTTEQAQAYLRVREVRGVME